MAFFYNRTSFTAGIVSPLALGHTDLDRFKNGCEDILNFIPTPLGGLERRPGTIYTATAKSATDNIRLLPFIFSADQAYILEFGDTYIRFYTNQGQLASLASITNGTFDTDISSWTDNSTGTGSISHNSPDNTMILNGGSSGVGSAEQIISTTGEAVHTVTLDVIGDTVTYKIGTTSGATDLGTGTVTVGTSKTITFTPATDPDSVYLTFENSANDNREVDNISVTAPFEITSPYTHTQLSELRIDQSFDEVYICHPDVRPKILRRLGASSWDIINVAHEDGPYLGRNEYYPGSFDTAATFTPGATTGSGITITSSVSIFDSGDVGRQIRYRPTASDVYGYAEIVGYTSGTVITVDIKRDFAGVGASTDWYMGAWQGRLKYPILPIFHEQRLWFFSTDIKPQGVWASSAGDFLHFSPDNSENKGQVDDDSSFNLTLATLKSTPAAWAVSKKDLQIGSNDVQISIAAPSDAAITPFNVTASPINSKLGSTTIPAIFTQNAIIFADKYGKKIFELGYFFEDDSFRATDLTILAGAVLEGKITSMVRQEEPYEIIWILTDEGFLYSCTYLRAEKVIAFARHVLGGTDVLVKSINAIPGSNESELWLAVQRTINSTTIMTVERLGAYFNYGDLDKNKAIFVDCALEYSGSSTSSISGLSLLEGELVDINGAGSSFLDISVTSGIITITDNVEEAKIGLGYTSSMKTVPLIQTLQDGTSMHRLQTIADAKVQFYKTLGARIGLNAADAIDISFREVADPMNSSAPLFTGVKEQGVTASINNTSQIYIEQKVPLPCTILALTLQVEVTENA